MDSSQKPALGFHHKIACLVMIICALALIYQTYMMYTMSDDFIIEITRAAAKMERDRTVLPPGQVRLSDEELEERIQALKGQIIHEARGQNKTLAIKIIMAFALIALALGIIFSRSRAFRSLAGILAVLLSIGTVYIFKEGMGDLEIYKHLESSFAKYMYFADIMVNILLPVGALACIVVFFAPPQAPAAARPRQVLRRPDILGGPQAGDRPAGMEDGRGGGFGDQMEKEDRKDGFG